ncbi:MAG: nicotinamide-nucleotide amidohydrolase family protein [Hyphomicrobiaceae bacterium]|nr:nicotinamide-nucleotide amidohydrolase family protein [Hyphomicrobiaceae bacterium]
MSFDPTFPDALRDQAAGLLQAYRNAGKRLATAESCTGGLVAGVLTAVPGSSDVVERGFVTYSNEAKAEMLGVPASIIAAKGAVSEEVARAMAEGALAHSRADVAVSVTGVAGPGGGSEAKPVGLVHLACAARGGKTLHQECRFGALSRDEIRTKSVETALGLLRRAVADR